ncbi:uncharacterized protein LOC143273826 [Peromyscus maniculatus bairdii]|uniref:uncharacterized protein LOC143273826 n=1 Tax=Peromyscus maniculatus bairdii TaxID=230844 RepID=UPI003FD4DBB9
MKINIFPSLVCLHYSNGQLFPSMFIVLCLVRCVHFLTASVMEDQAHASEEEQRQPSARKTKQSFSVSDPNGPQESSTEAPDSSNMDNVAEKNVIMHQEKTSVMEDQAHASEEEQRQPSARKTKQSFIDTIRACFCACFTKKRSSSRHHKK